MMKAMTILMVIAILLAAVACGSSGIDNGVSSQQTTGSQLQQGGHPGKDPGPQQR